MGKPSKEEIARRDAQRAWKRERRVPLPDVRRRVPVRLSEVPIGVRLVAARHVCEQERDEQMKLAVLNAALAPSDTVYWIAA